MSGVGLTFPKKLNINISYKNNQRKEIVHDLNYFITNTGIPFNTATMCNVSSTVILRKRNLRYGETPRY